MALWIVDNQPARRLAQSADEIVEVARSLGHAVIETIYDPSAGGFPYDLAPTFESDRRMILCGSVGFAAWAHDNWQIHPGAFRSKLLRQSAWLPFYGDLALNAGAIITTYGEFDSRRKEFEDIFGGSLFVKPADGGKRVSGTVLESGRSLFDAHYSNHRTWSDLPDEYRLIVGRVKPIFAEWRFVIAGDKVVARSQYKIGSRLESRPDAPAGAEAVAEAIAKHTWRPAEVFIADVAESTNGFRLLEFNTFGTSGFYDCDLEEIVRAVSVYAE